jgi:hypothetical protein
LAWPPGASTGAATRLSLATICPLPTPAGGVSSTSMLRCRLLGHRYGFATEGRVMRWDCERCGAPGGAKRYDSAEDAALFAAALDRRDSEDLGKRAPLGLLPLRLARGARRRGEGT